MLSAGLNSLIPIKPLITRTQLGREIHGLVW